MFNDNNNEMDLSATPNKKRKRTINTSANQYALYLEHLQNDEVFRTGVLNPTLPPDYLEQAWRNLTTKLNCDSKGPALTPAEWKKRFADWKNSTRKKYRTVLANLKGTGGGPPIPPEGLLSVLEEKALSLWGRVAVTGSTKVTVAGGLQSQCEAQGEGYEGFLDEPQAAINPPEDMTSPVIEIQRGAPAPNPNPGMQPVEQVPGPSRGPKRKREPGRPLNVVGDELLQLIKKKDPNSNRDLEERRLQLEESKFRFEVAKYKFENPSFEFEI